MHVGGDGETGGFLDLGKNWKRLFQSESPRASQARSVRLVERALIDKSDAETASDLLEGVRSFKCMRPAFQHARPGNHRERQTIAKTGVSRRDNGAWRGRRAAVMAGPWGARLVASTGGRLAQGSVRFHSGRSCSYCRATLVNSGSHGSRRLVHSS